MIDINDFDYIKIGLASTKRSALLVLRRGHQAGDHQLPHAQAREGRPLLRAHLRSHQGLGVLLRQVQARPLQGHHLRALRRRGHPPEGAARAHGSHRPGRARLAHLVLQGCPEPHRLPARHRAEGAREGPLLRGHICTYVDFEKREADLNELEGKILAEREQLETERAEEIGFVEERLQRRREFFVSGGRERLRRRRRVLGAHARLVGRGAGLRPRRRPRAGLRPAPRPRRARIGGEDPKKVRELVHSLAVREDRKLSSKDLDTIALARRARARRPGSGARHDRDRQGHREGQRPQAASTASPSYLQGEDAGADAGDAPDLATLGEPRRWTRPAASATACWPTSSARPPSTAAEEEHELRATANDLCLKADGKMTRDDHRQIEAWALKVREMVLEINQRRKDTDELYDERLLTLDQAWERVPRDRPEGGRGRREARPRAQGPVRLRVGLRRVRRAGHGCPGDPRPADARGPQPLGGTSATRSRPRRARSSSAPSSG